MRRQEFFLFLSLTAFVASTSNQSCAVPDILPSGCKCTPTDYCWPSRSVWSQFNDTLQGKLIEDTPPALPCYPGPQRNLQACAELEVELNNSTFIRDNPIALDYPFNNACPTFNSSLGPPPGNCTLGSAPVYTVNATTPGDVAKAVAFAKDRKIRPVIRNTGHDFLGRNTGYGSLQIWIRYIQQGLVFQDVYKPSDGCTRSEWTGGALTIGGGYIWQDVYAEAAQRGVIVVGGSEFTVGCIGGYSQGGGHSPASHDFGLAADQILEMQVVTAGGDIVTANACQNIDLFFALRGGGGGTYGVATSMTVKTYPTTSVVGQIFQMAPLTIGNTPDFMEAVAILYESYPDLNDGGYSGYGEWEVNYFAPVFGNFTTGYVHSFTVFNRSVACAQDVFATVAAKLEPFNGTSLFISTQYLEFTTYADMFNTLIQSNSPVGQTGGLCSRLVDRQALSNSTGLRSTLNISAGEPETFTMNSVNLISGGQVFKDVNDTNSGVNPVWRTSYLHHITAEAFLPGENTTVQAEISEDITFNKCGAWKALTPNTGCYMNEADKNDPEFLQDFYGQHLEKLSLVKRKYDPEGVFYCPTCIGSEGWHEDAIGRLCHN